jgi:NAD(P)-dependent dehydrogenase (short-subunit alcohol dehydrogenase family)
MTNKVILLTGSTSGIGLAAAKELVQFASVLILPVRNLKKGESLRIELNAINPKCQINLYQCDFASLKSVKTFTDSVLNNYTVLDVLANNAGIFNSDKKFTIDGIEETFQVNVLSQFLLNQSLLRLLNKSTSGRIVNLSSLGHKGGRFDINNLNGENIKSNLRGGAQLYFNSNLHRNLLTVLLADTLSQLKSTVTVNCMHPGAIATGLGTQNEGADKSWFLKVFQMFTKPAHEGAKTLVYLCLDESISGITGKYWVNCKVAKPAAKSINLEDAKLLFQKCIDITKE